MVHGLLLKYSIRQHREKHVHSEHSGPLIINISLAIALLMKNYYVTNSKDTGIWGYVQMTVSVRDGRGLARRWPKEGKLYYLYSDKRNTRSQYQGQSKPFFHGYSVIKGYPESAVPALESEMKWLPLAPKTVTWYTELRKSLCRWLRECYRQVEAVVVSNSRNKLHQTTYKDFFSPL